MSSLYPVQPEVGEAQTVTQPEVSAADAPRPALFRAAVESLQATSVRRDVRIEALRPPQRLAPWSYALSADITAPDGLDLATGRLVLLHDPDGQEAWDGVLRLVAYASAEMDEQIGVDPMLPTVGWSWLVGALDDREAAYRAAGGTVTQTTSSRFGDVAGPSTSVSLELRASWDGGPTGSERAPARVRRPAVHRSRTAARGCDTAVAGLIMTQPRNTCSPPSPTTVARAIDR